MEQFLDKRVEYAIRQLWTNQFKGDGAGALRALQEAANEGNGDAYFFLGRCYLGNGFVDSRFGFRPDDVQGIECFNRSIELGSAIGMFATRRLAGFHPRCGSFVHAPYQSSQEVWEVVNGMAAAGQIFCKYLIANAYYYGDVFDFLSIAPEERDTAKLQRNMQIASQIYEECIGHGITLGIYNYVDIVESGDYGMPVSPTKGAQLRALDVKMRSTSYIPVPGDEFGLDDAEQAMAVYQQEYQKGNMFALGRIGKLYLTGGRGVQKDYEQAARYLMESRKYTDWSADLMGTCFLKGYGVPVDYARAKQEFEIYPLTRWSQIGLGEMYAYGLGVPQDKKRAKNYFYAYPNDPRVVMAQRA